VLRIRRILVIGITVIGAVLVGATAATGNARLLSNTGYLGTLSPGQSVSVNGDGFKPNSSVTITFESTPIFLKTVVADANGSFVTQITIPAGVSGDHNIVSTGIDPSGSPRVQTALVLVAGASTASASGPTGPLAFTGMNSSTLVALAIGAMLIGAAAVRGSRRRAVKVDGEPTRETVDS
jgi:hypothetical protein